MSQQLIYLFEDQSTIEDFSTPRSQIVFGNENLNQRILRQLSNFRHRYKFKIIKIKQESVHSKGQNLQANVENDLRSQIFETSLVFFDSIAYSDSLIEFLIKNKFYYHSSSLNTIEARANHTISSSNDSHGRIHFPYENEDGLKVCNDSLFSVPLKLPIGIYPDQNYEVAITPFFYQPLNSGQDILKIQSCLARESTAIVVNQLKKFVGHRILEKIMNSPFLAKFSNKIGRYCKIHPTAVLESCVIGDHVEIGPHCYLRGVIVGDNAMIRENTSIKASVIGRGSIIVPSDIFNCFIGENSNIVTHILYHCVIGSNTFIGGGVGFADLKFNAEPIFNDDQIFFGAVVGDHCFIGAGLLFQAASRIPHHSKIINYNQINSNSFKSDQIFVAKGSQITRIPKTFFKKNLVTTKEIES